MATAPNPYAPPAAAAAELGEGSESPKRRLGFLVVLNLIGVAVFGLMCLFLSLILVVNLGNFVASIGTPEGPPGSVIVTASLSPLMAVLVPFIFVWIHRRDRRAINALLVFFALQSLWWLVTTSAVGREPDPSWTDARKLGYEMGSVFWPLRCFSWMAYYQFSRRVRETFDR